jgi:hypothetical protein
MKFNNITAVYSENHTKPINMLWEKPKSTDLLKQVVAYMQLSLSFKGLK